MKDWMKCHPSDVRPGNVIESNGMTFEVKGVKSNAGGGWTYIVKNGPDLTNLDPEEIEVCR